MRADQNQAVLRHEVKASERWQFETDVYRTRFHRNWYKLDGYLDSTETRISLSNYMQLLKPIASRKTRQTEKRYCSRPTTAGTVRKASSTGEP